MHKLGHYREAPRITRTGLKVQLQVSLQEGSRGKGPRGEGSATPMGARCCPPSYAVEGAMGQETHGVLLRKLQDKDSGPAPPPPSQQPTGAWSWDTVLAQRN